MRPNHFQRFGREYYEWRGWVYPFPQDDEQGETLDALHVLIYDYALRHRLHTADLTYRSNRLCILDVGSGTGKWTIEMASQYPDAKIIGIDLAQFPIRASFRANVHNFSPVDFTSTEWGIEQDSQDLAHLGLLSGSVPDWRSLYSTVFKYLKPGTGQIEHVEMDWEPRSSPEPFPKDGETMKHWFDLMKCAFRQSGCAFECLDPQVTEQYLENAGFVDIVRRKIRIPFQLNSSDPYEWCLTSAYRGSMISYQGSDWNGFSALSMLPLTKLGMTEDQVSDLCGMVKQTIDNRLTILYNNIYVYTARKPITRATSFGAQILPEPLQAEGGLFEYE